MFYNRGFGESDSLSGPGSDYDQTQIISDEIPKLLQEYNIKILLDLPCGDFYWMQHVNLSFLNQYIGADITEPLIKMNKKKYSGKNKMFIKKNIISDNLPKSDLIFTRDCLVHLCTDQIQKSIENIKQSGSTYLLATTFPKHFNNKNLKKPGEWQPLNLEIKPFNFPPPIEIINENCPVKGYNDKSMGLWKISDLP